MIGLQQKVVRYPVFYKIINLSNYGFLLKKIILVYGTFMIAMILI